MPYPGGEAPTILSCYENIFVFIDYINKQFPNKLSNENNLKFAFLDQSTEHILISADFSGTYLKKFGDIVYMYIAIK